MIPTGADVVEVASATTFAVIIRATSRIGRAEEASVHAASFLVVCKIPSSAITMASKVLSVRVIGLLTS